MQWVSTMFHRGGPTMFMITALIIPALALVGVHIGLRRRWSLWTSVGAITLILGIGLYGMMQGRSLTDRAVSGATDLQDRAMMIEAGYAESRVPMEYAVIVSVVLFLGVVIAQVRRREPG